MSPEIFEEGVPHSKAADVYRWADAVQGSTLNLEPKPQNPSKSGLQSMMISSLAILLLILAGLFIYCCAPSCKSGVVFQIWHVVIDNLCLIRCLMS